MTYALWRKIPAPIRFFCMRYFFGVAHSYSKIGRVVAHNRLLLAARYIDGCGIEIGGLGRPLKVGANAHVQYVDRLSGDDLKKQYAESKVKIKTLHPDIVANGETLDPIPDSSQAFVIANHVVEHFENPILFFKNAYRVLKDEGILFLAIPDKEKTFDHRRPVTSFEHISHDFINGPAGSRQAHFLEFATFTSEDDGAREARHYDLAAEN
jgi:SAM-dependent methyltransferase